MTTIYLTNWQYQMILDGMVSTHLDVLDHNNDGVISQLGDGQIAVSHRATPSIACGNPAHYVYASTELADRDDDAYTDVQLIGLSHGNEQAAGWTTSEYDFGGELMGYDVETLNKVIDYYNNGGSWNDDDFEKHVYEGIGSTGEKAPEGKYKIEDDGYSVNNPIKNSQLQWNSYVCHSYEDMLAINGFDESDVVSHTTDSQGRILTMTLTTGETLWANYDLSDDGVTGSFLSELIAAGATDIKYTDDGMIASYTLNGLVYNVSDSFGERSENDARTQELLSNIEALNTQAGTANAEKEALETEQTELEEEQNELTTKASAAKAYYEDETQKLNKEVEEANEINAEINKVNSEIEKENATSQKAGSSRSSKATSLNSKAGSLSSKLSSVKNNISTRNFAVSYAKVAMSSISTSLDAVGAQLTDVGAKIDAKNAEINNINAQIEEKQAELASLQ